AEQLEELRGRSAAEALEREEVVEDRLELLADDALHRLLEELDEARGDRVADRVEELARQRAEARQAESVLLALAGEEDRALAAEPGAERGREVERLLALAEDDELAEHVRLAGRDRALHGAPEVARHGRAPGLLQVGVVAEVAEARGERREVALAERFEEAPRGRALERLRALESLGAERRVPRRGRGLERDLEVVLRGV